MPRKVALQLDDKQLRELLSALRAGNSREASARFIAVDPEALEQLLARSPELERAVLEAEASVEVASVAAIANAAKSGDWRAASFLLERPSPGATPKCGARSKKGSSTCKQPRGHRTDHPGTGNCWLHGGRTPNGKAAATKEAAANALATLKIDASIDPITSLYEAVTVAAWREYGLRQMLQGRDSLFDVDHLGDLREDVVAKMHADALDARARIAKMAVDAGLDERMVRLAETQADLLVRLVDVVIEAAGAKGAARDRARAAASSFLAETAEHRVDVRELEASRS